MTGVSLEALQHVPLFVDWNKHEVEEIARLFNEHRFSKGETVVKEGSVGDSFFLIDSGEADVFIGGKGRTTLKPGDYFGGIALIDEGTRMAVGQAHLCPRKRRQRGPLAEAFSTRQRIQKVSFLGVYS